MAIPHVFESIQPQDFTFRAIKTHKKFQLQSTDIYDSIGGRGWDISSGSGYRIWYGEYAGKIPTLTDSDIENFALQTNQSQSYNSKYKHIIYRSIDAMYYRFPYDRYATFEHANSNFTRKQLSWWLTAFSAPYMDIGEGIKPGSVEITSSLTNYGTVYLRDDGNGNLYDTSIITSSFSDRNNLIAYWGFQDTFSLTDSLDSRYNRKSNVIRFQSNIFENGYSTIAGNDGGIQASSNGVTIDGVNTGNSMYFYGTSSINTEHLDDFNLYDGDYTISCWIRPTAYNYCNKQVIIAKNSIIRKIVYGNNKKYQNDSKVNTQFESSSIENNDNPVYPYYLYIDSNTEKLYFKKSNGINTLTLTASISDYLHGGWGSGDYFSVLVTKTGSMTNLYVAGAKISSGSDNLGICGNNNFLLFGAEGLERRNSYRGDLDEVRFYNRSFSNSTLLTIMSMPYTNNEPYQTNVVGNVFYRNGLFVISCENTKYRTAFLGDYESDEFSGDWTIKYRGTHTIYQYELLSRIKKGSFNLSQNPTARQTPYTDLLIDDMVTGSLYPYATSIGYYNDRGELMAVAKLNQPLQMRDDVDINIIARIDV